VDPQTGHLSIRLHDDEIYDTLTIKLAGGSMRRHGEKLVIRLDRYYVKVHSHNSGTEVESAVAYDFLLREGFETP
jgi:hypothetical protein